MTKRRQPKLSRRVQIVRSFSYKLNTGNYQSVDFFCSQKAECYDADAEETSERVYQFCKREVMKAVRDYREDNAPMTPEEIRQRKDELQGSLRRPA